MPKQYFFRVDSARIHTCLPIKAFRYHFGRKMSKQIKDISFLTVASNSAHKLLQKGDKNKVKTDDGEKFLVNAYLGDPSGTIKVTLWDRFCDLEEGKTYPFDNHLVRGEYKTQDIILVTPKTGCKAVENTPFKENLNYPSHLQQLLHLQKYLEFTYSLHITHTANANRSLPKNPQSLLVTRVA